jgi:ATP-dependent helicase/DNAse subunit B
MYIPGLSEGIFPAPAPTDPLLLDSERARLRARGIDLALTAERADDDGLFFELLTLARRSLTLTRPTVQRGEAHLASPLWDEARRLCPDAPLSRQRPGEPPAPAEVCTLPEAALSAIHHLRRGARDPETLRVAARVRAQSGGLWERIRAAGRIEARRLDRRAPPDRHSGWIESAALRAHLAERFGPTYRWSASALNLFGDCPYRFFAARVLQLDEFQAPDAALDARQRGSILHAALEAAYRQIHADGLAIAPENAEAAIDRARRAADAVLASAPQTYRFVAGPTWPHEAAALRAQIEQFVRADFSADSPVGEFTGTRRVHGVELRFGGPGEPRAIVDLPDGTSAHFGGSIDRIDIHERDGIAAYRVIDYKSGTTSIAASDLAAGRQFQMAIYLRAAAALLGLTPDDERLSGVFVSLASRKSLGEIDPTTCADELRQGDAHLARYIGMARAGQFAVDPVKPEEGRCDRYCPYGDLCRIGITGKG